MNDQLGERCALKSPRSSFGMRSRRDMSKLSARPSHRDRGWETADLRPEDGARTWIVEHRQLSPPSTTEMRSTMRNMQCGVKRGLPQASGAADWLPNLDISNTNLPNAPFDATFCSVTSLAPWE